MNQHHVAEVRTEIDASADRVWDVLTSPPLIAKWMFGAQVKSDWTPGSAITWTGEYAGQQFRDTGEVLVVDRPRRLTITHVSGSGAQDAPPASHTIVHELNENGGRTELTLTQDNNATPEAAQESVRTWATMLAELKAVAERDAT